MLIHILGSCSGTEPMPGRDYTSWVLEEEDGGLLWFDAGGQAGRNAYLKGLSPLKVKALFLSHPHLDHVGGLPGIFQTVRKEKWLRNDKEFNGLPCYCSAPEVIAAAAAFLKAEMHSADDPWDFTPVAHEFLPGEVYRDETLAVDALPNAHMSNHLVTGKPRSWSFRVRIKDCSIVYTGDVKSLDELSSWLEEPVDLLMLETGHHRADELCRLIRERNWPAKQLLFLHHGVEILRDPAGEKAKAEAAWGGNVLFASDGMTIVT